MIIEAKLGFIYVAGSGLLMLMTMLGMGEMVASLTDMSAAEADAWTFKGFLVLCVIALFAILLYGVKWVMDSLKKTLESNTAALGETARAIDESRAVMSRQVAYFEGVGLRAVDMAINGHTPPPEPREGTTKP